MDSFKQTLSHWAHEKRPFLLEARSSKAFVTFVVAYAVFADQFIFAVIIPVMPFTLHDQVNVPEDSVQYWVSVLLAVFGAATAVASPTWGWFTDRMSTRTLPFMAGLLTTTGATVMIWLGPNIALQIVGRILQGIGSAVVWVTGLALIADTVDHGEIGQYVGYLGIAMMVGTLIAPLLGGIVLAKAGYDAVFEMTIAIIALDIFLRIFVVEKKSAIRWIQKTSVESSSDESETDENHIVEGDDQGGVQLQAHSQDVKAIGSETTDEEQAERPQPRVRLPAVITLLASRRLLVALWGSLVVGAVFAGLESVLPLETEAAFGWDSVGGGLVFLPLTITTFFGPVVGWICDKKGPRWPIFTGFVLLCPFLTLLRLVDHNSINQKVLLCALLTLIGVCFTLTLDPLIAEISYIVEHKAKRNPSRYVSAAKAYAQAFGLFNMAYSLGNTIGPLLAGLIRDDAGWGTMCWVLGLIAGISAIPAGLWCGGWIADKDLRWSKEKSEATAI